MTKEGIRSVMRVTSTARSATRMAKGIAGMHYKTLKTFAMRPAPPPTKDRRLRTTAGCPRREGPEAPHALLAWRRGGRLEKRGLIAGEGEAGTSGERGD